MHEKIGVLISKYQSLLHHKTLSIPVGGKTGHQNSLETKRHSKSSPNSRGFTSNLGGREGTNLLPKVNKVGLVLGFKTSRRSQV